MTRQRLTIVLVFVLAAGGAKAASAQVAYDNPPINYSKTTATDVVAQLQARLQSGATKLDFDKERGYLPALLRELRVPVSSQALVFAKDSFQRRQIDREHPRALYFNEEVYVGHVPQSDLLEFAAVDPQLGATFYSLSQKRAERPQLVRHNEECLTCHVTRRTLDVPGFFLRSVFPDDTGEPVFRAGTIDVTHETPLKDRWGGWYVTGTHGKQTHMGNTWLADPAKSEQLDTSQNGNLTDLTPLVDTKPYLAPHSDIVALMVFEHQTYMQTLIVQANYNARAALWYNDEINKAFKQPPETRSESAQRRLEHAADSLLGYLLFANEAELTAPVRGTSSFASEFAAQGPRDKQGRSLREFDLETRLFRYPLSYLIYSPQFDALHAEVKERLWRRLFDVLTGAEPLPDGVRLSAADRQAILEILRDTKPDLPAYFRGNSQRGSN